MSKLEIEKELLRYRDVVKRPVKGFSATRYTFHDKPFLVFFNDEEDYFHIKVPKSFANELICKYPESSVFYSDFYKSNRWLVVKYENFEKEEIKMLIQLSLKELLRELPNFAKVIYFVEEPFSYKVIDFSKAIKNLELAPLIRR